MLGDIDLTLKPSKISLFICKPDKVTILGKLKHSYNVKSVVKLGQINELTFSVPFQIDINHQLSRNPNVDLIKEHYLIKAVLNGSEEWYTISQITKNTTDTGDALNVTAYALAYELKYKTMHYYQVTSYNCTQVLTDILNGTNWTIGFVDPAFNTIYREFNESGKTVLDILLSVQDTFKGTLIFDTVNRKINLYKLENIGLDKGFKVSYAHYLNTLQQDSLVDDMCTRLNCYGNNDLSIQRVNPTGQPYIDDFSYFIYPFERDSNRNVITHSDYMSDDLCQALLDYNTKLQSKYPVETHAESGTTTTNVNISAHGLVTGDYIINRTRGNVFQKVTVVDANNFTVASTTGQTAGDTIDKYKDGTYGKLLGILGDYQVTLTTKQNDMANLQTQRQIILDNQVVQQQSGTFNPGTTTLTDINNQIAAKQSEIDAVNTNISNVNSQISLMRNDVGMTNSINFSTTQLNELTNYIIVQEWVDSNYIDDMDLYHDAFTKMKTINTPKITYTVDIVNFLESVYEQRNWDKISIGDTITIRHDKLNINIKAQLIEVDYDFEAAKINLTISNAQQLETPDNKVFRSFNSLINATTQFKNSKAYWDSIAQNFDNRNDRNPTTPADPIVATDGSALSFIVNTDGSVNIDIKWSYNPTNSTSSQYDIDGFLIYVNSFNNNYKYTFGASVATEQVFNVNADKRIYQLQGVPADKFYTIGIQAYRHVDPDINSLGIIKSNIVKSTANGQDPYQPSSGVNFGGDVTGTVGGTPAPTVGLAAINFNTRNDRISVTPATPVIATDGSAITVTINADSTANITFNWSYTGTDDAHNIDGFQVYIYASTNSTPYTFGQNQLKETIEIVKYTNTSITFNSMTANLYYTLGVRAYREVDPDISSTRLLFSPLVTLNANGQNPLQPSSVPTYTGNVSDKPALNVSTSIDGFGQGADGVFNSTGNVTFTVDTEDASTVVRQYQSFTLNQGHTLTTDKRCRGLFIFVQGDVTINGTINMNGKSAKVSKLNSVQRVLQIPIGVPTIDIPFGGNGGAGGNGGNGISYSGTTGGTVGGGFGGSGTSGTSGIWFGGGWGGPGGGGGSSSDNQPGGTFKGGDGQSSGNDLDSSITTGNLQGGKGGSLYSGATGAGGGGITGGTHGDMTSGGSNPIYGGNGNSGGIGGGLVVIVAKGNINIGSTGVITCNGQDGGSGGNGADAVNYGASGGGGGQGSGGGGVIVLARHGNYINSGTLTVNAGLAGVGGTGGTCSSTSNKAYNGDWGFAGYAGTIVTAQV